MAATDDPDRRSFLKGLAACAVALAVPPASVSLAEVAKADPASILDAFTRQWWKDVEPIFEDHQTNVICYGWGGLREIEEYPYIESVSPFDIVRDPRLIPAQSGFKLESYFDLPQYLNVPIRVVDKLDAFPPLKA